MKKRSLLMSCLALFMITMLGAGLYSCENDVEKEIVVPGIAGTYTVAGKLVDANGAAMAGVSVVIDGVVVATTAADGSYSIPLTKSGSYEVTFTKAGLTPIVKKVDVKSSSSGKIVAINPVIIKHNGGGGN
ncbi:MAG: carboxypeptidase-like regulatory domain-containing protein [Bacteroidales bacterium]|nr:carboxypeptidase-like regulatory domain-containing protein [Bacteroidales bacterium]